MEPESEIPPPPYSEVDPQTPSVITESSSMGGGDQSPTSTLRPTSSQSMRAPSFITLRGGYLRGVPFSEDTTTATYFQERAFQFDPNRPLSVLHREITAETVREDLPYPDFDRDRDVSEQDWQTFVNYILTELGNETSSTKQHQKLQPAEFYERQTKLEQLIAEWNETFFQPRSIKFIAHYYYNHSQASRTRQESDQPELVSGVRKINIEDGPMAMPDMANQAGNASDHGRGWSSQRHGGHAGGFGFWRGGPFMRGGVHPGFGAGRGHAGFNHGHGFGHRHGPGSGPFYRGRQSHDSGHGHGRHRDKSSSSESSSSSSSDSDTEHHGQLRGGGFRGRRGRHEGERRHRRRRSRSASSDSSISSVSSISSDEMDEPTLRSVREAMTSFRLDPSNPQHNKQAYRQLLQHIRNQKDQALHNRSTLSRDVHTVSRAQRRALRDELRALRRSLKTMSKQAKQTRKAARKQEKAIKKASRKQEKAIRKAEKDQLKAIKRVSVQSASQRDMSGQSYGVTTQAPGYQMPGAFPDPPQVVNNNNYAEQAKQIEAQLPVLRTSLDSLHNAANQTRKHISDPEKKEQALAPIQEQIRNTEREIAEMERQVIELKQLADTPSTESQRGVFVDGHTIRSPTKRETSYGNRAGNYGEQLGRRIEVWGEQFGRAMEAWGEQFGREMERRGVEFGRNMEQQGNRLGRSLSGPFASGR